jgi:L-ascorbate metabolism protein UlaG (beta-lactamase superfamily)
LTHGHMDHLDGQSLKALARRFRADLPFIVPRGLSGALPATCRHRIELDWWEEVPVGPVQVALVPAHHWHRRGLNDTNRALWAGLVARGSRTVYHSGDTGWFDGFRAIGRVFPHIDVAVLPIGAYEPRWFMGEQHIAPEDVLQAFDDLGAQTFLAMHWGTFDLTDEPLDHGARSLLPRLLAERGLDPERYAVVAHGGSVGVGPQGTEVVGRLP